MKKWLYGWCLVWALACTDKGDNPTPDPDPEPEPEVYEITEDFEGARKDAYATGELQLRTGIWAFDDALIWGGATQADTKNGERALRIRNEGRISTTFKISNLKMVYLKHGLYGTDDPATWQLYIAPEGQGFQAVGEEMTTSSHTLKLDSFAITASGPVAIRIAKTGGGRLNIDDIVFKGTDESGIALGEPEEWQGGGNPSEEEPPRGVNPGDDAPPANGDNSNLLFGNPSNATADIMNYANYLIDHHYYVLSYNRDRGTPNWVSWHLDESNITGDSDRQDNFAAYIGIPENWYAVSHASYTGSGFNRGHNCPSADRTSSYEANSATFLMTNMIPQAPENNGGPWADLENDIRDQVRGGMEAYIIMGSYGKGGKGDNGEAETIDGGKVTVPERIWKVVLLLPKGDGDLTRVNASTAVIAVDMPNNNDVDEDWQTYRVSVDDIEEHTGYDLFSGLSEEIQEALEESVVVEF